MALPSQAELTSSDPCVLAAALYTLYTLAISGQQVSDVEYMALGVQRRVRYTRGDTNALLAALRSAQEQCATKTGTVSPFRRHPIQAGHRRRLGGGIGYEDYYEE